MKRKALKKLVVLLMVLLAVPAFADDNKKQTEPVPEAVKTYVTTHFPNQKIVDVEMRTDSQSVVEYAVSLDNQVNLGFDGEFQVQRIESLNGLPDSVIPQKLIEFVLTNYPDNLILSWKKSSVMQKIKLDNGEELEFDLEGNPKNVKI